MPRARPTAAVAPMILPDDSVLCTDGWLPPAPEGPPRPVLILCATIAHPVAAVVAEAETSPIEIYCTPGRLHDRPGPLATAIRARGRVAMARRQGPVFVLTATADTEGRLAATCREESLVLLDWPAELPMVGLGPPERDHFVATDLMVRAFDRLVWAPLGLDRHAEFVEVLFGSMGQFLHLADAADPAPETDARAAAARLGLAFATRTLDRVALGAALAPALA